MKIIKKRSIGKEKEYFYSSDFMHCDPLKYISSYDGVEWVNKKVKGCKGIRRYASSCYKVIGREMMGLFNFE